MKNRIDLLLVLKEKIHPKSLDFQQTDLRPACKKSYQVKSIYHALTLEVKYNSERT